MVETEKSRT
uniref:Uncharacterized protein n=1 Tax=Rhizophora mucronata TaxID=61149 RepID=A0A2P2LIB0_RHIMU